MAGTIGKNSFNLVDEKWIPAVGKGLVSLREIFSDTSIPAPGGNPVEKIAVFKLLLAVAQSAWTPADEADWKSMKLSGMQSKVLEYLDRHHDKFFLYGEKPFLQMPAVAKAEAEDKDKIKTCGTVQLEIATGNTTLVTGIQEERNLTDPEKALLLVCLMGFAAGGKKVDNSVILTKGYSLKKKAGAPGTSLGFMGFLHSFFMMSSIAESVYYNLFTLSQIEKTKMFPEGLGTAPWLEMPAGEDDPTARKLKKSYMGRLVPLCRFVLYEYGKNELHYTEGIRHPDYTEGVADPSVTIDFFADSKPKLIWADPEKRPWRQLTALLSFLNVQQSRTFTCLQLKSVCPRLLDAESFTLFSGGVRVSSNSGEQYVTGTDDYVDSEIQLSTAIFSDMASFMDRLTDAMKEMEGAEKVLYGSIVRYYKYLSCDGKQQAASAANEYWQLCEGQFQNLIRVCESRGEKRDGKNAAGMNKIWKAFAVRLYDKNCPKNSARQMEAWAANRPFAQKTKSEEA